MDGHNRAFDFFGGVPQSVLYDNDKCPVSRILPDGTRQRTRSFTRILSKTPFALQGVGWERALLSETQLGR